MRATVFANMMDLSFDAQGNATVFFLDVDIIFQNSSNNTFVTKSSKRVDVRTITNLNAIRTAVTDAAIAEGARLGLTISSGSVVLIGI